MDMILDDEFHELADRESLINATYRFPKQLIFGLFRMLFTKLSLVKYFLRIAIWLLRYMNTKRVHSVHTKTIKKERENKSRSFRLKALSLCYGNQNLGVG